MGFYKHNSPVEKSMAGLVVAYCCQLQNDMSYLKRGGNR